MKDEIQLCTSTTIPSINNQDLIISGINVKEFISKLTPEEREIIRKQFSDGVIDENDMILISESKHNIEWFLNKCKDISDIEKALIINAVWDFVHEVKRKVSDILCL